MKKKVLIISLLASTMSFGQSLTQANEPTIGQSVTMYVCDTATSSLSGTLGNNVIWDYSNIASDGGATSLIEIITPPGTVFPNADKAISYQGSLINYFYSTPTQRTSKGFSFNDAVLGNVFAQFDSNDENVVAYPFAFGNTISDFFSGNIYFTFNGLVQNPYCSGNSKAKIDGQGTLKLPSNTNLSNVIRYVLLDTIYTQVNILPPPFPPSNISIIRSQYEYYELTSSNLPKLVYTSIDVFQSGSTAALVSQKNVLSSIQPNHTAAVSTLDSDDFMLYPNPSNGTIQIKGNFNETISLEITDQAGRIVYTNEMLQKEEAIVLNTLNKGLYHATIKSGAKFVNKKIIIE